MRWLRLTIIVTIPLLLGLAFTVILPTLLLSSVSSPQAQAACIDARIDHARLSESAGVPPEYVSLVEQAGMEHNVPPAVLAGLIEVESRWNPTAVGPVTYTGERARGIAQFMPGTALDLGINPFDPVQAIDGAARYLASMTEMFDGNIELGLAAYNAGPGRVIDAGNRIPQIEETQNYVVAVMDYARQYSGSDGELLTSGEGAICPPLAPAGEVAELAVEAAMTQLGNRYVWGGNNPSQGFDCSGLMVWAYNQAGLQLPARQSTAMYEAGLQAGQAVPNPTVPGNLQPGDLLFWATGRLGSNVSHVAMYVGNGQILEARTRTSPIEVTEMRWDGFVGATRPAAVDSDSRDEQQVESAPVLYQSPQVGTSTTWKTSLIDTFDRTERSIAKNDTLVELTSSAPTAPDEARIPQRYASGLHLGPDPVFL